MTIVSPEQQSADRRNKGDRQMKLNFLVRVKNKAFWLAVIPALALVA